LKNFSIIYQLLIALVLLGCKNKGGTNVELDEPNKRTNLRRAPSGSKKKPQGRNKKRTSNVQSGSGNQRKDSKKLPSSDKKKPQTQNLQPNISLNKLEDQIKKDWDLKDINDINKGREGLIYSPVCSALRDGKTEKLKRLLQHPKTDLLAYYRGKTALQLGMYFAKPSKEGKPLKLFLQEIEKRHGKEALKKYIMYQSDNESALHSAAGTIHMDAPSFGQNAHLLMDILERLGGPNLVAEAILQRSKDKTELKGSTVIHQIAFYGVGLKLMQRCVNILKQVKGSEAVKESMNQEDDNGITPIFLAAGSVYPNLEFIKYMIQQHADITHKNKNGTNILHCVVRSNKEEKMNYIFEALKNKPDVNLESYILQRGWELFPHSDFEKYTPIEIGAHSLKTGFSIKLIKEVRSKFVPSFKRRQSLESSISDNSKLLAVLLPKLIQAEGKEAFATFITSYNVYGYTPFHISASHLNFETMSLLVKYLESNNLQNTIRQALKLKIIPKPNTRSNHYLTPLEVLEKPIPLENIQKNDKNFLNQCKIKRERIRQLLAKYK